MNSVLIVLPILSALMFGLGLELRAADFAMVFRRPRAIIAGLVGQIVLLPAIAWLLGTVLNLEPTWFLGLMLIACCPGGSSSNVFSGIAKGDVALSVSLTACSSVITLVTLPLMMGAMVHLPLGNLIMQNVVLVLFPVVLGMVVRKRWSVAAEKIHRVLGRCAFPALMLLAAIFFVIHRVTIAENFALLGTVTSLLILLAMAGGYAMGRGLKLNVRERRTLVIEVGMQNAAQAIAWASSPVVFNDSKMAIPAIVYSLMMNVILLIYVAVVRRR
jgi:BASS family bile acid:Na+ symporter